MRPPEEWEQIKPPHIECFIAKHVGQKLLYELPKQMKLRHERSTKKTKPKKSNRRHKHSECLLTGKIESKQDSQKLVGTKVGKKGHESRRYCNKAAQMKYLKSSVLNNAIDAEVVERAILNEIHKALQDSQNVHATLQTIALPPEPEEDTDNWKQFLEGTKSELTPRSSMP